MSIETTVYSTLSGASGVTNLVSTRIYPLMAPDSAAVPYITYQVIAGNAHDILIGAAMSERKLVQINCVSNSYSNAKAIATAVKAAFVNVGYCAPDRDDYFPQTENYRTSLDVALIG